MKWKASIYWIIVFVCISFYFFYFASYTFDVQEEMQLFIPSWHSLKESLLQSGGMTQWLGMFSIQYFSNSLFAAILNGLLVTMVGVCCYSLLQKIHSKGYNLLLSLILPLSLCKTHLKLDYLIDGTYAFVFMMLLLVWVFAYYKKRMISGVIGSFFVYWFIGQIVFVYGLLFLLLGLLIWKSYKEGLLVLFTSFILGWIGCRFALQTPLTDGFANEDFFHTLLQPDGYIYYVWIRLSIMLAMLCITVWALRYLPDKNKMVNVCVYFFIVLGLLFWGKVSMPDESDMQNRMMDSLNYLTKRQRWSTILNMHQGKQHLGVVSLNYVNMALSQEKQLGNRMFDYTQRGPLGLIVSYNLTYYISIVLSDVFYTIGDIASSESYAVEAQTLARRGGGSPRAMQRIVQTSLIRGDKSMADKYLRILKQLPKYRQWAERYETYLTDEAAMRQEKEIGDRLAGQHVQDNLLTLIPTDELLKLHLTDSSNQRTPFEYVGCYYLLDKDLDKMRQLLELTDEIPECSPLPKHFQEAAAMMFHQEPERLSSMQIDHQMLSDFSDFLRLLKNNSRMDLNRKYGNTFWHYYYLNPYKRQ
ncbi:MAG: hypothetical protein IJ726_03015 [Phocaeicola sp.]|nr:hypothetical protein [Phocaeicola sp.]